ncbi:MAG: peptidase C39, partial [Helicobacter sp.]|nr:peptidase C39 [Helicobacter sp.]
MEKVLRFFLFSLCFLPLFADFAVKSFQELRNQNLVRQSYEESCGAASLATLIRLIDFKRVDELEVLEYFTKDSKGNINTDMVSFLELQKAAQKMGYKSASYQMDREALEKIQIPLLVKIEDDPRFPHFVVIIN